MLLLRATGFCLVLASLGVFLVSCDDTSHLTAAVEALKARERKVVSRETANQEREQGYAERERQLAASAASLEKQRAEVEALKQKLLDEIAQMKRRQEALLEREKRGPPPTVSAERVIVVDAHNGEVLAEKNADRKEAVASTQKLMTALLVAEAGHLDDMVTIAKEDSDCGPVKIIMSDGDKYSRRQLLTALMIKSFNNVARALARDNAGSLDAFAKKMNDRAEKLGMSSSRFLNPNGLPADGQYSTARDMAKVALAADVIPELRTIFKMRSFTWTKANGGTEVFENTNRVLRTCEFCDGMKTGFTNAAGYCLISSGEKGGKRRIVVVLNGNRDSVWKDSQALLEWSLKG